MTAAKKKLGDDPYAWQNDWTSISTALPDDEFCALEFLVMVSGLTKSKILRKLLRTMLEQMLGQDFKLNERKAQWVQMDTANQMAMRKQVANAMFDMNLVAEGIDLSKRGAR